MSIIHRAIQWIFPITCSYCGKEDTWLCDQCINVLPRYSEKYHVDKPLQDIIVATSYGERAIANLIQTLKYNGVTTIAQSLSHLMIRRVEQIDKNSLAAILKNPQKTIIVPVPLHPRKEKERGFNQADLLAQPFASHFSLPLATRALRRVKNTIPQASLTRQERLTNTITAFALNQNFSVKKKNVILIDDVATTGATVRECARVLQKAGCADIYAVVIARGKA